MPQKVPQGSHIVSKNSIYRYRRRLPDVARGEVCTSLRTRNFREAEHRAALLDRAFDGALRRARDDVTNAMDDLNTLLRGYLQEQLARDLQQRMARPPGSPVYGYWWEPGDEGTATDADLYAIRQARDSLKRDLAENSPKEMEDYAAELVRKHDLPDHLLGPLTYGLIEAAIRGWEVIERRTLGTGPLVFSPHDLAPTAAPQHGSPAKTSAPLASSMVETFGDWGRKSGGWTAGAQHQAQVSVGLLIEACGDRPIDTYTRADGDKLRDTLRRLPRVYRKSAKDRERSLTQITAEADAAKVPRLAEKTLKRDFWAVSRFFAFLIEAGRLATDADNPGRGFTFNTKGPARKQRDMWEDAELHTLFISPIWSGCHPFFS